MLIKKKTKGLGKKEQLLLQPIMSYTLESHNTIQTWLRYWCIKAEWVHIYFVVSLSCINRGDNLQCPYLAGEGAYAWKCCCAASSMVCSWRIIMGDISVGPIKKMYIIISKLKCISNLFDCYTKRKIWKPKFPRIQRLLYSVVY